MSKQQKPLTMHYRTPSLRIGLAEFLPGPVDVLVLEGTHHLAEPLVLTAEDAGDENHPVTWSAYPGHHPVLSGGTVINGWKPSEGKIFETQLPDVKAGKWKFR